VDGVWRWKLILQRQFFTWEEPLSRELENVINGVVLVDEEDSWVLMTGISMVFLVLLLVVK
jgi:hypothetical protein